MVTNIEYCSTWKISHTDNSVSVFSSQNESIHLVQYIKSIVSQILGDRRIRNYRRSPNRTTFRSELVGIMENQDLDTHLARMAKRLLDEEIENERVHARLGWTMRNGVLIISKIRFNTENLILIARADDSDFLDESNFDLQSGLPIKRIIYKAVLASINSNSIGEELRVFDTNTKFAQYWWHSFLELEEIRDNTINTKTAIAIIESKALSSLRAKYPADHQEIRNATIHYFKTQENFEIEDFVNVVIGNYQAISESFTPERIEKLKNKLLGLPTRFNFDDRFEIDRQSVKIKVRVVKLTPEVDLSIKGHLPEDTITAVEEFGRKFVKIESESGFEIFKPRPE